VDGQTYSWDSVNSHQIQNADLHLFKIAPNSSGLPSLPGIPIATATPSVGSNTVMIGAGRTPSASPTKWYVDEDTDPWTWQTTDFPGRDSIRQGYETTSSKAVRWGTNLISGIVSIEYGSYSPMDALATTFSDGPFATTYEAQAVTNDSGSGMFVEYGGGWRLAGLIVTVSTFSGQPGANRSEDTAVFGNNTFAVDLADYAAEINSIIPEPGTLPLFAALVGLGFAALHRRRTPERGL